MRTPTHTGWVYDPQIAHAPRGTMELDASALRKSGIVLTIGQIFRIRVNSDTPTHWQVVAADEYHVSAVQLRMESFL